MGIKKLLESILYKARWFPENKNMPVHSAKKIIIASLHFLCHLNRIELRKYGGDIYAKVNGKWEAVLINDFDSLILKMADIQGFKTQIGHRQSRSIQRMFRAKLRPLEESVLL